MKSVQSTHPALLRIGEAVQGQLRRAGITLEHRAGRSSDLHAQIRKDLSPVTLYQAARFPVADVYLTQFFHSTIDGRHADRASLTSSHCAAADSEIEAARSEPDVEKQKALVAAPRRKKSWRRFARVPLWKAA